ncbi:antirepressor AbbA [Bacillus tianshenii]|nr:antirepressor AbbA [Bacillus tianshenii]
MMKRTEALGLTNEQKSLLVKVLFDQEYALEVVSCQINDIERGEKEADEDTVKELNKLYDQLAVVCE